MARTRITKTEYVSPRTAYRGGALLLAVPFVLAGGFFALLGFGVVDVELDANAPLWVIGCVGLAFFLAGAMVGVHGVRGLLYRARRHGMEGPWDPAGTRDRVGARVGTACVGLVLFGVFLVPFHWWAFHSDAWSWFVRILTGFFELLWLLVAGNTVYLVLQALKYGPSRLTFRTFPFFLGERLDVAFRPNRFDRLKATLRFVEEVFEVRGAGENRRVEVVAYALHEQMREVEPPRLAEEAEIAFDLPADPGWGNDLGGTPVRYWELLVEADTEGIDFRTTFLLPVYARERQAAATATASPAPTA